MKATKSQSKTKALKPLSARTAPEATDSHAAIEDWIRRVMPDLHPIVKRLDAVIEAELYRFPAISPASFRRAVEEVTSQS